MPVARRLIARGISPAAGIAFMIAGPILNPIVLFSTWVAYAGRGLGVEMTLGRAAIGLVVAITIGWAVGRGGASLPRFCPPAQHDHQHTSKGTAVAEHLAEDFLFLLVAIPVIVACSLTFQAVVR